MPTRCFIPPEISCGSLCSAWVSPTNASATDAARIGPGQRTTAVPTRRQVRVSVFRFGSNRPKRLQIVSKAGAIVSAATTATSMPIANGMPNDWKYGSLVKCRQNVAPAMVRPEPRMT